MAIDFGKAKGSKTLKDVATKSNMMSNATMVVMIEMEKLLDNPDNEYLFGMKEEDIEYAAHGILENGFKGAIEVYDRKDGMYEIYSGHIRKYAGLRNGMKEIPCLVYPMPETEAEKRRNLLGANLFGRNKLDSSNPILVARQIQYHEETLRLEEFKGDMRAELAKEFGISGSQIYKYQALLGLIEPLQNMVAEKKVPYSAVYLAKGLSLNDQEKLAEQLVEKEELTRTQVVAIIKGVEAKEQPVTTNSTGGKLEEEEQLPGQMSVQDYPNIIPTMKQEEDVHGEQDYEEVERIEYVRKDESIGREEQMTSKELEIDDITLVMLVKEFYKWHVKANWFKTDPRINKEGFLEELNAFRNSGGTMELEGVPYWYEGSRNQITFKTDDMSIERVVSFTKLANILIEELPIIGRNYTIGNDIIKLAKELSELKKSNLDIKYQDNEQALKSLEELTSLIQIELNRLA